MKKNHTIKKARTKYHFIIQDTDTKKYLKWLSWAGDHIRWVEDINKAKKWGTIKTLSGHFINIIENEDRDFNEIPLNWQIRKFEVKTEVNELEEESGLANDLIFSSIKWPNLIKLWSGRNYDGMLKAAVVILPKTLNPKFAIRFDGQGKQSSFDVNGVRSLLIKAKKRMTGEMRVFLRYRTVFVSNEDDLSIVKLMLSEHIRFIVNMDTGLDPAGREIEITNLY